MQLVSVIIPAYNKSALTVKTVESVLAQTYPNIEVLVVDDGSTDGTREALKPYEGRIRYFYKENGGACSARNAGLREARGAYVGFLDCDDLYLPEKVAHSVHYLRNHPKAGSVHTAAEFIDAEDQVVGSYSHPKSRTTGRVAHRLIFGNYICNSTMLIRRPCLDEVGGFDESIFMPADWDLWLRLAERFDVGYLDTPLTRYRVTDNYIFNRLEESEKEERVVIDKFLGRHPEAGPFLRRRILSQFHLRYAQGYFLQDRQERFKEEFHRALRENPFNLKAYVLFLSFLFARGRLRTWLRGRILRTSHP